MESENFSEKIQSKENLRKVKKFNKSDFSKNHRPEIFKSYR